MILGCRNETLQNPFWLILNHSDLIFNTRKKLAKSCGETAIMTQRRADNDGIPQATTKNFDNSNLGQHDSLFFKHSKHNNILENCLTGIYTLFLLNYR